MTKLNFEKQKKLKQKSTPRSEVLHANTNKEEYVCLDREINTSLSENSLYKTLINLLNHLDKRAFNLKTTPEQQVLIKELETAHKKLIFVDGYFGTKTYRQSMRKLENYSHWLKK